MVFSPGQRDSLIRELLVGRVMCFFVLHVLFLTSFWKSFSASDKKQIRSLFFRFCKCFLSRPIPIWTRFSTDLPSIMCLASLVVKSINNLTDGLKHEEDNGKRVDSVIFM